MISRLDFRGSPHVGIFCVANDNHAFVPKSSPKHFISKVEETLGVDVVKTSIANTGLLGIFCAINNKRAILTGLAEKDEIKKFKECFSDVVIVDSKFTAIGNLVAMNDKATACSKFVVDAIKDSIGIKVADSDLVGSALYVNNHGLLAHRDTTEKTIKDLKTLFGVEGDVGTVNLGDPFVASGIAGNKKGVVVGAFSSGPEMNRIDEVFMLNR